MCQLDNIMAKRAVIHKLARRHKVRKVYVFGSCARKAEKTDSDIDFLMDFDLDSSWHDHIAMQDGLTKLFGCKVDVVSKCGLHPYIEEDVLRNAVEI